MLVEKSALDNLNPKAVPENAIALIDTSIPDWQTLAAGVTAGTEVFLLDGARDGVVQITKVLQTRQNIAALHIISHGRPGSVQLGNIWLDSASIDTYALQFIQWRSCLTPNADILIYGCNIAHDLSPNPLPDEERELINPESPSSPQQ